MPNNFPLPSYYFDVTIGPHGSIGFQEVQGLGADIEYEENPDIANADHTNRTFKKMKYKNLILKKGVFQKGLKDMERVAAIFFNNESARGERQVTVEPVTITIELMNEAGDAVITWELAGAVPVKYEFGALNAMESNILVETMEFQYESMKTTVAGPAS
jgi:phage tail-like protein